MHRSESVPREIKKCPRTYHTSILFEAISNRTNTDTSTSVTNMFRAPRAAVNGDEATGNSPPYEPASPIPIYTTTYPPKSSASSCCHPPPPKRARNWLAKPGIDYNVRRIAELAEQQRTIEHRRGNPYPAYEDQRPLESDKWIRCNPERVVLKKRLETVWLWRCSMKGLNYKTGKEETDFFLPISDGRKVRLTQQRMLGFLHAVDSSGSVAHRLYGSTPALRCIMCFLRKPVYRYHVMTGLHDFCMHDLVAFLLTKGWVTEHITDEQTVLKFTNTPCGKTVGLELKYELKEITPSTMLYDRKHALEEQDPWAKSADDWAHVEELCEIFREFPGSIFAPQVLGDDRDNRKLYIDQGGHVRRDRNQHGSLCPCHLNPKLMSENPTLVHMALRRMGFKVTVTGHYRGKIFKQIPIEELNTATACIMDPVFVRLPTAGKTRGLNRLRRNLTPRRLAVGKTQSR